MDDRYLDDVVALLPPLLQAMDRLGFVSRHLDPPQFGELMAAIGAPEAPLQAVRPRLDDWPDELADAQSALAAATDETLAAFGELHAAGESADGLGAVFRALRHVPAAQAALYPLAQVLPPVSRFFLAPEHRDDTALAKALAEASGRPDTGVMHFDGEPGARGGWSAYVPETYATDRDWPVVFALHGGSGNGGGFLWSWLREARTWGAILVAPTSIGRTWALQGDDPDTPNLMRILDRVRDRWRIDSGRLLLSGMSDGGTFSYVSGLEPGSPFTHLAPAAAAFHPMMAAFADRERIGGRPIHIVHGARDWMFPVSMAREAAAALEQAGAAVTYREIDDLSHSFPRELNGEILDWMVRTPAPVSRSA
jgi:phospholipase/carboxylesterase